MVPILLLEGLGEGLILRTVEREPRGPGEIHEILARIVGQPPERKLVFPVIQRLEQADLIRAPDQTDDEPKCYHLTQAGARRLADHRELPASYKAAITDLLDLQAPNEAAGQPGDSTSAAEAPSASDGWVDRLLARLPESPQVMAPYAQVSLAKDQGARAWTLRVEHHEARGYDGASACPLTFLYEAATRLLYGAGSRLEPVPQSWEQRRVRSMRSRDTARRSPEPS